MLAEGKPSSLHRFDASQLEDEDVKIFDGAPHAFENEYNITGYRQDQTAEAWSRTFAFLAKTLK